MASKIQIVNLALAPLGGQTITSFTDGTREANLAAAIYDEAVKTVLSQGNWTAATYRAELAKTTTTPSYEFSSEFQLPTSPKLIKLLAINESYAGNVEHRVEGDKLVCNLSTVKIKYIGEISDSGSFGEYIKDTLVAYLKAEFAYAITGNAGLAERMIGLYRDTLSMNLSLDGQQGNTEYFISPDLIDIRGDGVDLPE